jgi:hypothetical protein
MLGHTHKGLCWTGFSDATGITILAPVMPDLQIEGAIPKIRTAFHAESASCAKRFLNRIFEIRRFNKCPADRACRTNLVFCSFVKAGGVWLEVTKAELAIATHLITMRTFNSRGLKHAFGFTLAALNAFSRIKLPDLAPAAIDSGGTIDKRGNDRPRSRTKYPGQQISTRCFTLAPSHIIPQLMIYTAAATI